MPEVIPADASHPQAEIWMNHALELARQGEALASPNPMVGAVAVQEAAHGGRVVGEGFHTYAGLRHAEIVALQAAGAAARGSTLSMAQSGVGVKSFPDNATAVCGFLNGDGANHRVRAGQRFALAGQLQRAIHPDLRLWMGGIGGDDFRHDRFSRRATSQTSPGHRAPGPVSFLQCRRNEWAGQARARWPRRCRPWPCRRAW